MRWLVHCASLRVCVTDQRNYPQPGKFRHHSVEDEYYNAAAYGYGYYNGYYPGGADKYGPNYRSQPGLYRDGAKYPAPANARGYQVCVPAWAFLQTVQMVIAHLATAHWAAKATTSRYR